MTLVRENIAGIEYDDQLLGVSIVCIRGDAGNYAMRLKELLSVTYFYCHRVFKLK